LQIGESIAADRPLAPPLAAAKNRRFAVDCAEFRAVFEPADRLLPLSAPPVVRRLPARLALAFPLASRPLPACFSFPQTRAFVCSNRKKRIEERRKYAIQHTLARTVHFIAPASLSAHSGEPKRSSASRSTWRKASRSPSQFLKSLSSTNPLNRRPTRFFLHSTKQTRSFRFPPVL
jgi:hypothetical protein